MLIFNLVLLIFNIIVCLTPSLAIQNKKVEQLYVQKEVTDDLANSASGYMYRSDGHGPATYVDLGGHPLPPKKYGLLKAPVSAPSKRQSVAHYAPVEVQSQQQYYHPAPQAVHPVQYVAPVEKYVAAPVYVAPQQVYQKPEKYSDYILPVAAPVVHQPIAAVPYVESGELGHESGYKKGGGEKYDKEHYNKHGEKGEKGYDSKHAFDKGQEGHHGKEEHKGYYDKNGGHKAGYDDTVKYYSEGEHGAKGSKGENFHESKGHKKGSKTEGFHNVYHKDEYKKDHTFYDESDNSGHHEKYGDEKAYHAGAEGGYKKGGSGQAAYERDNHGKKGYYDKGHFVKDNQGHKGASGGEKYYNEQEKYGKDRGHQDGKQYGYSSESGSGGKYY